MSLVTVVEIRTNSYPGPLLQGLLALIMDLSGTADKLAWHSLFWQMPLVSMAEKNPKVEIHPTLEHDYRFSVICSKSQPKTTTGPGLISGHSPPPISKSVDNF
ncbi:hypothetical protein MAR_009288 [Mya arenaria]|uniref:Uncharacterized protein n=1 Tax=Mya arenaria TaxID=6604 RepID=A0ABY7DYZ4_MYAAR|nr:hypothetical protein MAR_009288 [Mya arenaria]